jgi:hypothetical protein
MKQAITPILLTGRRTRLLIASLLLAGCGLVNQLENFKGITFQLPGRRYSVSTDDSGWKAPPGQGIPAVTCGTGGMVMDCCAPPAPAPAIDCTRSPLVCDAGICALKFNYEQVQPVDLAKEVPALANSKGQVFSEMLLKSIDLAITENTMNITLPPVAIYLAPSTVTSASDPSAKRIATMSMKSPGFTGNESLPLDDQAQKLFSAFAHDFQTPFNIIISTTIVYRSGAVVPQGKLGFTVGGKVEAKF